MFAAAPGGRVGVVIERQNRRHRRAENIGITPGDGKIHPRQIAGLDVGASLLAPNVGGALCPDGFGTRHRVGA